MQQGRHMWLRDNVFTLGDLEGGDHLQGLGADGSQYKNELKNGNLENADQIYMAQYRGQ
jgi:hypothetical protein